MEYGFTRPQEIKEPEHVFRGSQLHLSRELQTEDYIGMYQWKITKDDTEIVMNNNHLFSFLKAGEKLNCSIFSILIKEQWKYIKSTSV